MKDLYNKIIIGLLGSVLLFSSCDSFSVVVPVEIEEQDPLLAVGAYFSNDMEYYNISVSSSVGALGSQVIESQDGSLVRLYENGTFFDEFVYNQSDKVIFEKEFIAGNTYRLEVEQENFETISTELDFPSLVELDSVKLSSSGTSDLFDEEVRQLTIYFDDPVGEDYYEVLLYQVFDGPAGTAYVPLYPASNQFFGQVGTGSSLFFTDQTLVDGINSLQMNYSFYEDDLAASYIVELRHINKDYFAFDISMEQALIADGNPFSEPVQVVNAIENGFGVVGFWNSSFMELEF